jgi:hypothetical protein
MVTKWSKDGFPYKEPPYSDIELNEFYKSLGPPTIVASARPRGTQAQAPKSPRSNHRQKLAAVHGGAQPIDPARAATDKS